MTERTNLGARLRATVMATCAGSVAMLSLAVVAGCSTVDEGEPAAAAGRENEIYFATHMGEHPGWVPAFEAISRRYEERTPGVSVRLHYQPLDGYQIWAETQFMSGRGPDILDFGAGDAHR